MKVRHKIIPVTYDVIEESPQYYIGRPIGLDGVLPPGQALYKHDYVVMPEEKWVNVTSDVRATSAGGLEHCGFTVACTFSGYRLVKYGHGAFWHFTIEKKVSG